MTKIKNFKLKINRQNTKKFIVVFLLLTLLFFGYKVYRASRVVAIVNQTKIYQGELDQKLDSQKKWFDWQKQVQPVPLPDSAYPTEKEILSQSIDQLLIDQYSSKNNINVTDQELLDRYTKAYKSLGTEDQYLAKIWEIYGLNKDQLLDKIKKEMIGAKLKQQSALQEIELLTKLKQNAQIKVNI